MGWNNPPIPWSELERTLSGRRPAGVRPGDGGDSPAWSRHRADYVAPPTIPPPAEDRVPYAELHCHSNFSFLDGASHPEELVEAAALLGLEAIAITDHDGMYGVVRFAEAAKELGVRTVFGTELSLGLPAPQNGVPDPEGEHLLLLARDLQGYRQLCDTITNGHLAGQEKGKPEYDLEMLYDNTREHCVLLTGCRKSPVRRALELAGIDAAAAKLQEL